MKSIITLLSLPIAIPLLLFFPGYLTHLWFTIRKPLIDKLDWLETAFVSVLFSLCLTGWVGLVLVELAWFSLARLLFIALVYCLGVGALVKAKGGAGARQSWRALWASGDRWTWCLAISTVIAILLYSHPHEYVLGGSDAGVYVNLGAHIVRTGSLVFQDPELAGLDPASFPALFRQQPPSFITHYIQFPGFYVSDDQAGLIIPQFYPLHPIWLAVGYSLGGVQASLYVTPLWGALASLAAGLAAATLFGRRTGALAAALLTITATQIWFARYPTSEALTQLLLFGGIFAFARYMVDDCPEMGILAGASLGQVMLARPDHYFLLAVPLIMVGYLRLTRQLARRHLIFLAPFLFMSAHSLAHGLFQSWPYLYNTYRPQFARLPVPALVASGLGMLGGLVLLDLWVNGHPPRLAWVARGFGRAVGILAAAVVLAALYAYFIWPGKADPTAVFPYWYADELIPYVEPYNLVRLGWYVSPLGIALAVLGTWWMLRHELSRKTAVFFGIGLFFSFLFIQNSRNNPHHIYVMRRYVPAVIPTFTIAAAYAIERWWRRRDRWRWLAPCAAVVQVVMLLYAARIVVRQVDHRGLVAQLTPWVESLDPDDVILFDDDRPVSTGTTVGTPLHYLFGHTVFDLQETYLDREILTGLIGRFEAQGRRVLIAVGPDGVREPFASFSLAPLPGLWLETQVLESSYLHFPREVRRARIALGLYELSSEESAISAPLRVDVGSSDFFYLGDGWHSKERLADGTTMRWMSGAAQLGFPPLVAGKGDAQLRFQLATSPQSGHTPTEVTLRYCGGIPACDLRDAREVIAHWQVGTTFAGYEARIPTLMLHDGALTFWLETDSWNPLASGLSADDRDLGVMVDWVSVNDDSQ